MLRRFRNFFSGVIGPKSSVNKVTFVLAKVMIHYFSVISRQSRKSISIRRCVSALYSRLCMVHAVASVPVQCIK